MNIYSELKSIWKKLGVKGQVKNFSSIELWVIETDTLGKPIARILPPGFKTPKKTDVDGFKRVDGKAIKKHKSWWKFYDFSTIEIFEERKILKISAISITPVDESHFNKVTYIQKKWGSPIVVILDVKKGPNNKIFAYFVSGMGWLDFNSTLKLTCNHVIDNARPVFPQNGRPYIRSKRDKILLNNFTKKVPA